MHGDGPSLLEDGKDTTDVQADLRDESPVLTDYGEAIHGCRQVVEDHFSPIEYALDFEGNLTVEIKNGASKGTAIRVRDDPGLCWKGTV